MIMKYSQLTSAQKAWVELEYGMFIHFGPNTFEGKGWGDGTFPPENFCPNNLNVEQWAEVAAEAGMKYAVLTIKHHDGFCLWPSKYTEYSVKNSPNRKDILGLFVDNFRKAGLKVGVYYSLWDRNYPDYENDDKYAQYMKNQLTELLTGYGEIAQIWFDGAWDKDYPTRMCWYDPEWENDPDSGLSYGERWHWKELYDLAHKYQPLCMVSSNTCSDRPGEVKYMPVDYRNSEHFDFCYKEKIFNAIADPIYELDNGESVYLPLEYETTLTPQWFWIENQYYLHPSVDTICGWYRNARENNANLLLNVGPNKEGLVPKYTAKYLTLAAKELFHI